MTASTWWLCAAAVVAVLAAVVVVVCHVVTLGQAFWPTLGLGLGLEGLVYACYGNAAKAFCREPL